MQTNHGFPKEWNNISVQVRDFLFKEFQLFSSVTIGLYLQKYYLLLNTYFCVSFVVKKAPMALKPLYFIQIVFEKKENHKVTLVKTYSYNEVIETVAATEKLVTLLGKAGPELSKECAKEMGSRKQTRQPKGLGGQQELGFVKQSRNASGGH